MKRLLFTILTLISINSFGQQWIEYQVDSTLQVMILDNYEVKDTLDQRMVYSKIDNGMIIISIIPNTGQKAVNIQSEEDLLKAYKGFKDGVINSSNGQLIKEELIEKSGLKMLRFSFSVTIGDERQILHCITVFVNAKVYSINFVEVESMSKELTEVREKLFSSLKLPPNLGLNNQMNYAIEGTNSYNSGYLIGQIAVYGTIIVLLIAAVRWNSKRGKKKEQMTNENKL